MRPVCGVTALLVAAAPLARLPAQGFPTTPPRPTRLAPARFPPFQEATLPNGLELVVIARPEQPVVSVTLTFRAGGIYDPPGKEGLASLVAELLSKGTATRSAEQIAATIEGVGGSLSAAADEDFLTVSVDALSDQVELVFDLLGDVTLHSSFPESEFALARTRALSGLTLELSQPASVASRFFGAEIYGRNPYGRSPTRDSYQAVTGEDVTTFATQHLRPAGALLVVAGDVTEPRVRELVERAFAGWHGTPPPARALPSPPNKTATDILLVHRPGSAQANIVVGNPTIGPTDPAYYAARVATQVLGGGADSRLFLILREQRGWTYGAYAALVRHRGLGYWQATAEVRTAVTDSALRELLRQVERARTEAIPDSELRAAKGFLVGSFPRAIETANQIATQVASAKLLGLGEDYLRLYRDRLSRVTALEAKAAAARLYRRQGLTIVVVGDAAPLFDRLQAIAPVRLVDPDGHALTAAELHPPAPPSATVALDPAQFAAHRDSSQVLVQGKVVGFLVAEVRRTPDSLVYVERSNLGNGAVLQQTTVLLNPADGSVRQVDQVITQQAQRVETHLTYAGGRVRGQSGAPQPDGTVKRFDIDTVLPPGTADENAVPFLVPTLPLAAGQVFTLNVFTPSENAQKVLTFNVSGPDSVTVAGATYRAYRVAGTGSRVPFVMYVSTDTPRRVLKTELVGQPFAVEVVR
ncbi:MAG TPA: pitrilysin family protein [Gemmatimonadales bacterium]|nr:pitrilysin family protein [Gemmatimonadales bacterium]